MAEEIALALIGKVTKAAVKREQKVMPPLSGMMYVMCSTIVPRVRFLSIGALASQKIPSLFSIQFS